MSNSNGIRLRAAKQNCMNKTQFGLCVLCYKKKEMRRKQNAKGNVLIVKASVTLVLYYKVMLFCALTILIFVLWRNQWIDSTMGNKVFQPKPLFQWCRSNKWNNYQIKFKQYKYLNYFQKCENKKYGELPQIKINSQFVTFGSYHIIHYQQIIKTNYIPSNSFVTIHISKNPISRNSRSKTA